jgi:hypothetical protein
MARFAVVMPAHRPPRRGFEEPTADLAAQRAALVGRLSEIFLWATSASRLIQFIPPALSIIDAFALDIETSPDRRRTVARHAPADERHDHQARHAGRGGPP